jgi:hypothetical protein
MKAIVAVLAGVVILAAGVGVYRWMSGDEERARAESAAEQLTAFCKGRCDVIRVEPMSGNLWRFHVRDPVGGSRCMAVDLEEFRVSTNDSVYVGGSVEGTADTACGPDWWNPQDAERRLADSPWAKERKAELISCAGRGGSPGRSYYFRRFRCRYSHPGGDGIVLLATMGPATFELEPSG